MTTQMKATEQYIPMVKNNYSPKWGRYLPLFIDTEVNNNIVLVYTKLGDY